MIESYYVESSDGLYFAVKGLIHPPHAIVAYLRYIPDPDGDREKKGRRYRRLYHFEEQKQVLEECYPAYFYFDPVFGERIQAVPHRLVERVYDPCRRLAELRHQEGLDELEEKAVEFADLLATAAKVPERSIGISGSILVGLHTPTSDLDIVVYGSQNCLAIHQAMRDLLDQPGNEIRRLEKQKMRRLYAARSQDTPMSFEDFARLEGRKVIQGQFGDREYFVRFVKDPAEIGENYGERRYLPLGDAKIQATVVDASEAIFTPCTYKIDDVHWVEVQYAVPTPEEIVSFRGRFCEQAREGERIIANGKLERVLSKGGESYHRLVLGQRGHSMTVQIN